MQELRVRSTRTLSRIVIAGLVINALVSLGSAVHELSASALVDRALAGEVGAPELYEFDRTTSLLGLAGLVALIGTGVIWLVWQYFLVRSVEPLTHDEPVKTPFRSVLWWFAPLLNLFVVPEIYGDLRAKLTSNNGSIVGQWWGMYVLANVTTSFSGLLTGGAATPEAFVNGMNIAAVTDGLTIVAAILGIRLIAILQAGQDALLAGASEASPTGPIGAPPADASPSPAASASGEVG